MTSARLLCVLFFLATSIPLFAGDDARNPHDYIEELAKTTNIGSVYYEDGASDGSVLDVGIDYENDVTHPLAAVRVLVDLKHKAIPLLIDCLDDTRATSATYTTRRVNAETPAPLGFVCLDILSGMVDSHPKVFIPDCADDGLGACYQNGFYFRPDVLMTSDQAASIALMRRVKENWRRAMDKGWLRFHYPGNWKIYPVK